MLAKSPQNGWWNVIKMPSDSSCCCTTVLCTAFERALSMFRCVCVEADGDPPQKTGLKSHRGGTADRFLVPPLHDQCLKAGSAVDVTLHDVRRTALANRMLDPTVNDPEQINAPWEDLPVLSTNEVRGGTRVRRR